MLAIIGALVSSGGAFSDGISPVRILFDTDLATDCDDAGALAMLHGWADSGEVELLAMGINTINPYTILCLDALNTWYGRGTLPIGVTKASDAYVPNPSTVKYARQISEEYPRTHPWAGPDDAPDVVGVYRAALAAQPDIGEGHPGVVVISVGMLTNIRDLLQSGPCAHSPLIGIDLVKAKVRLWSCMGGRFVDSAAEYNIKQHLAASQHAVSNWPVPVVFSPWEVGDPVRTGAGLQPLPTHHILRRIYQLSRYLANGRQSWDQCAALYAVLGIDGGPAAACWTLSGSETVTVHGNGRTTWAVGGQGLHQYKTVPANVSASLLAAEIEGLMVAAGSGLLGPVED